MFRRIDHIEIVPVNMERSFRFCTEVLGFAPGESVRVGQGPLIEVAYLHLGDTTLELLSVRNPARPDSDGEDFAAGYRMMALEVSNMDGAIEHLRTRGVSPSWGPVDLGGSIRAEIRDPDGLGIELRDWKRSGKQES